MIGWNGRSFGGCWRRFVRCSELQQVVGLSQVWRCAEVLLASLTSYLQTTPWFFALIMLLWFSMFGVFLIPISLHPIRRLIFISALPYSVATLPQRYSNSWPTSWAFDWRTNMRFTLGFRLWLFVRKGHYCIKGSYLEKNSGWHVKSLSQAGKAVLIQSVVQAIPSYAMSCFRLQITLIREFQSLAENFFWHDGDCCKVHWLAWNQICHSKLDGGLDFWNLKAFNLALLAKQLWQLPPRLDSLVCKVLKAKYFPHSHLFEARLGARPSYTWRSVMAAWDFSRLVVGGTSARVIW
ncbi:UNVERIFIED_CONTAM: putative mitochondrial protein [Sesamum radiatum]|uniref:Mitochondrial protein n=1 Tax=Sesamum radiatum TaxID=300843 RepID=A0AAW2LPC2_SESRA